MRLISKLFPIAVLLFSLSAASQPVSKDSLKTLNRKSDIIELEKQVNTQKIKLAGYENALASKKKEMESKQKDAQNSADKNAKIASGLSDDPDNKKLARKAEKAAKAARKDARQLRNATGSFEDLQKDIQSLKKKVADNEQKLTALQEKYS